MQELHLPHLDEMVQYLKNHPVLLQLKPFGTGKYASSEVDLIESRPAENALELQCWGNVAKAVEDGMGSAIYGWAFWPEECKSNPSFYMAQHHAVLREHVTGSLVDVTPPPATYEGRILFMADNRVPYSSAELKQPPMLLMNLSGEPWRVGDPWSQRRFVWVDHRHQPIDAIKWKINGVTFDNFDIIKMG